MLNYNRKNEHIMINNIQEFEKLFKNLPIKVYKGWNIGMQMNVRPTSDILRFLYTVLKINEVQIERA